MLTEGWFACCCTLRVNGETKPAITTGPIRRNETESTPTAVTCCLKKKKKNPRSLGGRRGGVGMGGGGGGGRAMSNATLFAPTEFAIGMFG